MQIDIDEEEHNDHLIFWKQDVLRTLEIPAIGWQLWLKIAEWLDIVDEEHNDDLILWKQDVLRTLEIPAMRWQLWLKIAERYTWNYYFKTTWSEWKWIENKIALTFFKFFLGCILGVFLYCFLAVPMKNQILSNLYNLCNFRCYSRSWQLALGNYYKNFNCKPLI